MTAAPTSSDLAALLGRTVTPEQGAAVLQAVSGMVKAYVRGGPGWQPNDELRSVILTCAARLVSHARQIGVSESLGPHSASWRESPVNFSLAERLTMDRYRRKAL